MGLFRRREAGRGALARAIAAIREQTESAAVVRVAAAAVHGALDPVRTLVWIGGQPDGLELARVIPEPADGEDPRRGEGGEAHAAGPSAAVIEAARSGRVQENPLAMSVAAPIAGAHLGLLGVLQIEGTGAAAAPARDFVTAVAAETGLALEAAELWQSAHAEREKSAAILGGVGDGVVVTDPQGRIVQWNDAAERITHVPRAEAVDRRCCDVLGLSSEGVPLECTARCELLRESDDSTIGHEVWRERGDGERQPLLINIEAVRGPDGAVSQIVHSMRDITRLKEADAAKTLFLATASHELKTPLTVIQGFADALKEHPEWDEGRRLAALEAMWQRSKELDKIVNRLLLSSRIEAGRNRVDVRGTDLAPVVRERVTAMAQAHEREISIDLPPEVPDALVDPNAIATVIDHLLDNAIKYSPDGGEIVVSMVAMGERIALSVSDRGIGMSADQAAECFEKFWQAESSDERRFGGTGIGLFIVRSLVEAMDGTVTVESEKGVGSTFTCALPAAPGIAAAAGIAAGATIKPEPSTIREFMRQIGVPEGAELSAGAEAGGRPSVRRHSGGPA